MLSALRRDVCARLSEAIADSIKVKPQANIENETHDMMSPPKATLPYLYNISNHLAREFYESCGTENIGEAFEIKPPSKGALLMQCRHCLRYSYGYCVKNGGEKPSWHEPLRLVLPDGRRFPLQFDCKNCQMLVYAE